jgi:hypothetical protein
VQSSILNLRFDLSAGVILCIMTLKVSAHAAAASSSEQPSNDFSLIKSFFICLSFPGWYMVKSMAPCLVLVLTSSSLSFLDDRGFLIVLSLFVTLVLFFGALPNWFEFQVVGV